MKIPKPTEADRDHFKSLVPDDRRVEIKPMFGNVAAFARGNMFMGLFGSDVGVRLDESDRDEPRGVPGAGPFGPEDRPMKEYVTLPAEWRGSPEASAPWIERALEYGAGLPPKKKR
jgi:TfoX/Sxy family transcriptional regulator of competence genes